jgi:hypothetical protein
MAVTSTQMMIQRELLQPTLLFAELSLEEMRFSIRHITIRLLGEIYLEVRGESSHVTMEDRVTQIRPVISMNMAISRT